MSDWQTAGFRIMPGVFCKAEVTALQNAQAEAAIARSRAGARHLLGEPYAASRQLEGGLELDVA